MAHSRLRNTASPVFANGPLMLSIKASRIGSGGFAGCAAANGEATVIAPIAATAHSVAPPDFKARRREIKLEFILLKGRRRGPLSMASGTRFDERPRSVR